MKGSLSTAQMNLSDGGKQLILTQNGWYDVVDPITKTVTREMQQMWYLSDDGTLTAKGALSICRERGLHGIENLKRDDHELRALLSSQPDFMSIKPELPAKLLLGRTPRRTWIFFSQMDHDQRTTEHSFVVGVDMVHVLNHRVYSYLASRDRICCVRTSSSSVIDVHE